MTVTRKRINRFLPLLLSLCILLPLNAMAAGSSFLLPGDLDQDGKPTASDALLALQRSVGLTDSLLCSQRANFIADINGDGKIDAADALLILQVSVGMDDFTFIEPGFTTETVPLNDPAASIDGLAKCITSYTSWRREVEALRKQNALTQEQAIALLVRYDSVFFQDNVLIYGVDTIASATDVTASRTLCADQRILVMLRDATAAQGEARRHLVLVVLSQRELQQTGRFSRLDAISVAFDRDGTIPHPNGGTANYFYGPHDAFDYAAVYEIDSREALHDYARHAYEMISDEQLEQWYDPGCREGYLKTLLVRDSDAYFEAYRTLIFEEHAYARASTRYVYQGLEDNGDGTQTLMLDLVDDNPLPEPENPEDVILDSFLTVRMTQIDLPADANAAPITRICNSSGIVLWEGQGA